MQEVIQERFKISPFLVIYMVLSMQIGIGVLGFQRIIAEDSGHDAWISVLVAGASLHIIMWMIYKINESVNGDIVTAHEFIAGKWVGKILSSIFIAYFLLLALTVVRTYVEVIQVWMFTDINLWWFSVCFFLICIYIIYGGFRTVVGISFFSFVFHIYLYPIFFFNLQYAQWNHLTPIFENSIKDILLGSFHMSLTFIGFEVILFFYPFIKEPQKSKKWAHFGLFLTTIGNTILMIISIVYFSKDQLAKSIWPTLTMWKIVKLPFVERFEYIGIGTWSLVILPNVCITIWIASRLLKRIINIKQKHGVIYIVIAMSIAINFIDTREKVSLLNDYTGLAGFGVTFIYIPLLFIILMIMKKVKKK